MSARRTLLVLSIALVLVTALVAQTPDTAIIRGRITDGTGAVIVGAHVSLKNAATGKVLETATDRVGEYRFAGVKIGPEYQLTAKADGFAANGAHSIVPTAGSSVQFDVALLPAGATDNLDVRGTAGEVRTDQPQLGTPISELQIEAMPLGWYEHATVSYLTTSYLYGPGGPAVTCSSGALSMSGRPFVHGYEIYL